MLRSLVGSEMCIRDRSSVSPSTPRAPFGRRPSSRSQAAAQDTTAGSSAPFGGGHHSSGTRSNNELAHNAVMDALFRRHSKAEAAASARRQQQEANTRTTSSANQTSGGSSNSMSVSVPNLTTTMEQTVSLLETFAMVARRNLGNNSGSVMSAVTGSNNNPCSSLVRLALSSNSPGISNTLFHCQPIFDVMTLAKLFTHILPPSSITYYLQLSR